MWTSQAPKPHQTPPARLLILRLRSFLTTSLSKPGRDIRAGMGSLDLPLPLRTADSTAQHRSFKLQPCCTC